MSTDVSRFELGLQQLEKVPLSKHEMMTLKSKHRVAVPVPFRVFLYTMEQLADHDKERSSKFEEDMRSFLEDLLSPSSLLTIIKTTLWASASVIYASC